MFSYYIKLWSVYVIAFSAFIIEDISAGGKDGELKF